MKKIITLLQKVQIAAGGFCLAVFVLTVIFQIFSRYIGVAATWTEDVSLYAFIWAVFMGASAMVFERQHFAFASLVDNLKNPIQKILVTELISLVILIFSALMLVYGFLITRQFWNYRWVTLPALKRGPIWMCLPIAGAASSIYTVYHMINDFLSFRQRGA
jgi:TRAP-type C4-dicarboxylate transport system permease small subunit